MKANTLLKEIKTAVLTIFLLAVLLCGIYPVIVWGVAQLMFPTQANGSLIRENGRVIGSGLLGQAFSGPRYFHPRPSAAGSGYDAAHSGGSNLGPLAQKLIDQVEARVNAYRLENHIPPGVPIPADAVTASGSGLDPHISSSNAALQAGRVARERGIPEDELKKSIRRFTEGPDLGFLGEPGVNVLKLNLALDGLSTHPRK